MISLQRHSPPNRHGTSNLASDLRSSEILVVITILLLLAGIALPTTKDLIKKQTGSRSARSITTFFDIARNRAIAENRNVGVLIERLVTAGTDPIGRSAAIRLRQMTGVPTYSGDAADAVGIVQTTSTRTSMVIQFDPSSNQLLTLSASLIGDQRAPIRNGDRIELPGWAIGSLCDDISLDLTRARFRRRWIITADLTEPDVDGTVSFPAAALPALPALPAGGLPVRFRIHRRPTISTHNTISLPRGYAIDLNYSGYSQSGNEFAPPAGTAFSVAIVFDPSGKVAYVSQTATGIGTPPPGQILFVSWKIGWRSSCRFVLDPKRVALPTSLTTKCCGS